MDSINAAISFHDLTTAPAMLELWMKIMRAQKHPAPSEAPGPD
jgi:hypothetical protein